ncbi:MAG: hypothetical protein GY928_38135 [Colwellia sp.]|nr:hypothetical protein [Colwellia sp.]
MNEDQPAVVNSTNATLNRIVSRSGHELIFDDHKRIPKVILQNFSKK